MSEVPGSTIVLDGVEGAAVAILSALQKGDLLLACDLSQEGLQLRPGDQELHYLHVLTLARLGDIDQALALEAAYGLAASDRLEPAALHARLLKDRAFQTGASTPGALKHAADAYFAVYQRFNDPFPGINAASLALMSGDADRARALAGTLISSARLQTPHGYFDMATCAEALLLLGRTDEAQAALLAASQAPGAGIGAMSTTRSQILRLADHLGLSATRSADLLACIAPPKVAMFCGHMFPAGRAEEADLLVAVDRAIIEHRIKVAYGPLARGADIAIAERVLAQGGELNVVLPFRAADFVAQSIGDDADWRRRYEVIIEAAASVTQVTDADFVGDPYQFRFGSDVAMGLARVRAGALDGEAVQLAVWDGMPPVGVAGTATDVATWQAYGGTTVVIPPGPLRPRTSASKAAVATSDPPTDRVVKAILFADFPGFSKLPEDVLPAFWREVMRRIGHVLDRHGAAVAYRNSWGDAVYTVIDTAAEAASISLEMQEALADMDREALMVDAAAGMRIGAHLGPIYRGKDFVTGEMTYFGTQVSRTARIEPITPPGAVYVTEPFAAILALQASGRFRCSYVGRVQLAKAYGTQRMYRLHLPALP